MSTSTQNPDGSVTLDDGSGKPKTVRVVPNATIGGWCDVQVFLGTDVTGTLAGTPHRLKINGGGAVGGDSPGVNSTDFVNQPATIQNPLRGQIANT